MSALKSVPRHPSARANAVIVGAGIGGLACAVDLAARGVEVDVYEQAAAPGGKMRELAVGEARIDAGPTVFTMRWVFEELFAAADADLADRVGLRPMKILARHGWQDQARLDLLADRSAAADAIGAFAGPAEGRRYLAFCEQTAGIYRTLRDTFIRAPRPTPISLVGRAGASGLMDLWRIKPFGTLWTELCKSFENPRLRQLFGRYATYAGSSPFLAPATLMLIAHVEQEGVWMVDGGMHRLAEALAALATERGARIHYGRAVAGIEVQRGRVQGLRFADGERQEAGSIIFNGDVAALPAGLLGPDVKRALPQVAPSDRSLSAITWSLVAPTEGFPLLRHSVFFSDDYAGEFDQIFRHGRPPREPTVYCCAQDRDDGGAWPAGQPERLLVLMNAPAAGDSRPLSDTEVAQCADQTFSLLRRCGLSIHTDPGACITTTPTQLAALFPATGGALYGQASHGWRASFSRPGSRSAIPGLYLAGGSTHPGAGVPMAALSGRLAASCVLADLAST